MVNRSMADKEWMALSENQLTTQGNQIKTLQGDSVRLDQLQKQIEDLQGQNQALKTDGSKVLSAYQTENDQLRSQISTLSTQMQRATAGPSALYGAGAPPTYQRSSIPSGSPLAASGDPARAAIDPASAPRSSEVKLLSFGGDAGGTGTRMVPGKTTQFTDSENYLPPNSIATAKVVVGVDATTNTKSQTDPLPVVLRITGPRARSMWPASCSRPTSWAAWSMARRSPISRPRRSM
jgi:conjugal transfer pilus assembly protein TraB